jgi:hypothetical protein
MDRSQALPSIRSTGTTEISPAKCCLRRTASFCPPSSPAVVPGRLSIETVPSSSTQIPTLSDTS